MFNKGWRNDELPINAVDGSWVSFRNGLLSKGFESITNEKGLIPSFQLTKSFIGIIAIPTGAVVFSTDNTKSEIGIYNNGVYSPVINTTTFGFRTDKPIEGVFRYDYNGDLIVCWTDNNTKIKILNLNTLPFQLTGTLELVNPSQSILADLFPDFNQPIFTPIKELNSGALPEGVIYIALQYKITEYDNTNWSMLSQPIPVTSLDTNGGGGGAALATFSAPQSPDLFPPDATNHTIYTLDPYNVDTPPDPPTFQALFQNLYYQRTTCTKGFQIEITNLDTRYIGFRIAIIVSNQDGKSAYSYNDYEITGNTATIIVDSLGSPLDINDIIIPSQNILTAKTMTTFENKLLIANTKTNAKLAFQPYANNIQVTWDTEVLPSQGGITNYNNAFNNHYYNSAVTCAIKKTFQPFEAYALYIHLVYKDGSVSEGFHIPGRQALPGDKDLMSTVSDITANEQEIIDSLTRRFHMRDTSTSTQLGYWENLNEVYPNTDDFLVRDASGQIGDFRGQPVRHHRIPTHRQLASVAGNNDLSNIININFSNIYIPPSIAPLIQGFTFSYAKRTLQNQLIVGESLTLNNNYVADNDNGDNDDRRNLSDYRFYDLLLIKEKPTINPTYIKTVGVQKVSNNSETHYDISPAEDKDSCISIVKTLYLQIDNAAQDVYNDGSGFNPGWGPYDGGNRGKEECLLVRISTLITNLSPQFLDMFRANLYEEYVCQLVNNSYDIYLHFYNQPVVMMGGFHPVVGSATYSESQVYGGDVVLTRQFFRTLMGFYLNNQNVLDHVGTTPYDHIAYVYSPLNYAFINIQYDINYLLFNRIEQVIPTYNNLTEVYNIEPAYVGTQTYDNARIIYPVEPTYYNLSYIAINDLINYGSNNPLIQTNDTNPFIIWRSVVQQTETLTINWRRFLANDYQEMSRNRGEIWKISTYQRMILIHQKYSLSYAPLKDILNTSSTGGNETYVGTGDIFDRFPIETLTTDGGTAGCQSQFATFVCEFGYFSVDIEQGFIYLFDGKLNRISDLGLVDRFKDLLGRVDQNIDNPYQAKGLTASYDSENKRIILTLNITKPDGNPDHYSISYNCVAKIWACSRHDYAPSYIFYNRIGLFSVTNSDRKLYIHNAGLPGVYYNGITYPLEVDMVFNIKTNGDKIIEGKSDNKLISSIFWQTASQNSLKSNNVKDTFTTICVYTNTQSTGIINVVEKSPTWFKGNSRELDEGWYYNDLRDVVIDRLTWVHDNFGNINLANLLNNVAWFKKSKIISKFIIVKASYDNTSGRSFYINELSPLDRVTSDRI